MSQKPTSSRTLAREHPLGIVLAALSGILHVYVGYVVDGLPNGAGLIVIAIVYFIGIALAAAGYKRELLVKIAPVWVAILLVLWAVVAVINLAGSGASRSKCRRL